MKNQFKTIKFIVLFLVLSLTAIAASAQDNVSVPLGDIPPSQQITITYDATVGTLPAGLLYIENQGVVTGTNFDNVIFYSDDPDTTTLDDDATLTSVGFTLDVETLPNTGQTPWWRITLISLLIAGTLAIVAYIWKSGSDGKNRAKAGIMSL